MPSWKRTFWAVWLANLVTAVGMLSFLPFFPSYLRELGVEDERAINVWTGVIVGAAPFVAAFMSPIWGALGDRIGRKLMVVRALCAIGLFVGAMGFAQNPWQLLVLRILQGAFSGFVPPSITLVSVAAPKEQQGRVSARMQMALGLGQVGGPALGGLIASGWGHRPAFFVVSALAFVSLAIVAVFAEEDASLRRAPKHGSSSPLALLRASLRDLASLKEHVELRRIVLLLFWIQFGSAAMRPQLELYVGSLGGAKAETAALFMAFAVVHLAAMPLWGRLGDVRGHERVLRLCGWGCALTLALHACVWDYPSLMAVHLVLGAIWAGSGPSSFGAAATTTSVDERGGAMGAVFSARALAISLAAMLGGVLAAAVGLRGLFLVSSGVLTVALLLTDRRRKRVTDPSEGRTTTSSGVSN